MSTLTRTIALATLALGTACARAPQAGSTSVETNSTKQREKTPLIPRGVNVYQGIPLDSIPSVPLPPGCEPGDVISVMYTSTGHDPIINLSCRYDNDLLIYRGWNDNDERWQVLRIKDVYANQLNDITKRGKQ